MTFALNPDLDRDALREKFTQRGRISIPEILAPENAAALLDQFINEPRWNLVCFAEGAHRDYDAAAMAALPRDTMDKFLDIVHTRARSDFQYLFANFPIFDLYWHGKLGEHLFGRFYEFANSPAFLSFAADIVSAPDIAYCDAQATKYESGHFLTSHDDDVEGKGRRAAYVFNMTPEWRADWGGLLQFIEQDGNVSDAFAPSFNTLNMFRVPQPHSVSLVAPFAGASRYSITGWLRAGDIEDAKPAAAA